MGAEATAKRTTPEFFAAHTVSELWNWSDFDLENEGRLTHPMVYDQATDRYLGISWEALAKIGAALRALPYPNMTEFYTSGRASNEAAFPLSAVCAGIRNQQLSSNSTGS
jgi:anaerobic selenocysteine-containing dehydrogenase